MKKIYIVAVVVLILALIAETVFLFQQFSVQQKLTAQQSNLQQNVSYLEKEKAKLEGSQTSLQSEVQTLIKDKQALAYQQTKLEEENKTLNDKITSLDKSVKEKTATNSKYISEIGALKRKLYCKDTLTNVDFSSNEMVSEKLASYVKSTKGMEEPVSAHYWNLIWTGDKYSVHTVEVYSEKDRMNYIWKFTVYYKGESYGNHVNGIFYNDDQCWMYLDK